MQDLALKKEILKNAEAYYKNAISLPLFPTLTLKEQNKVIEVLRKSVNLL